MGLYGKNVSAIKLKSVSIKNTDGLNEAWVQDALAADPSLLELGEVVLKDKERLQPRAGRLDLLFEDADPESNRRYEVEVQLGATDESHLIRTLEYWDIERKRYPQYDHVAVIVAEHVTSRFLNVIQLFNGYIPLIAIKMTAYEIGEDHALTFVRVLDEVRLGLVGDGEKVAEPTDRNYWEQQASVESLQLVDSLTKDAIHPSEPNAELNYTKGYIGLRVNGSVMNFTTFAPRKKHVIAMVPIAEDAEITALVEESDLDNMKYDKTWNQYRFRIGEPLTEGNLELFKKLVGIARSGYGKK